MEARRGPRMVVDPKVRQVGFITPGSEPVPVVEVATAVAPEGTANSPSPVMIPLAPSRVSPLKSRPVPVPSPPMSSSRKAEDEMPLGSYNPSDSVLVGSPSACSEDVYTELSASVVATINSNLMEMSIVKEDKTLMVKEEVNTAVLVNATETGGEKQPKKLKERTSRAERRALQESQRAAKAAAKSSGSEKQSTKNEAEKKPVVAEKKPVEKVDKDKRKDMAPPEKEKPRERKEVPAPRMQFDDEQRVAKARRRAIVEQTETKHRVELFRHLPQYVHAAQLAAFEAKFFQDEAMHIHHAVYEVGLKYLTWDIVGGNARCTAMLRAFSEMISDHVTPPEKTISRDLLAKINSHVSFLTTCRPLSISMGNAIKFLKLRIAKLPVTLSEQEAKASLVSQIDTFIQEKIILADKEIVKHAVSKIRDRDVLLTHGSSCVVTTILCEAHRMGKDFRVVVLDSRPRLEGRGLLRRLQSEGIRCTYTHVNAVSYIMQEVTKVFLGAASVLANGTVYSRVGTAGVAMVAHALRVPVMICCETYKFHERVQLDSICCNELGDPDSLVTVPGRKDVNELGGWAESENLQLLNLLYDATPVDYVSMIITELGMVPPTSVPVILREYRKEPTLL